MEFAATSEGNTISGHREDAVRHRVEGADIDRPLPDAQAAAAVEVELGLGQAAAIDHGVTAGVNT